MSTAFTSITVASIYKMILIIIIIMASAVHSGYTNWADYRSN